MSWETIIEAMQIVGIRSAPRWSLIGCYDYPFFRSREFFFLALRTLVLVLTLAVVRSHVSAVQAACHGVGSRATGDERGGSFRELLELISLLHGMW